MEKFRVVGVVTVTVYTEIEAKNEEEALQIARERSDMMSVCSNNADSAEDVWMVDELDGTPFELTIEN